MADNETKIDISVEADVVGGEKVEKLGESLKKAGKESDGLGKTLKKTGKEAEALGEKNVGEKIEKGARKAKKAVDELTASFEKAGHAADRLEEKTTGRKKKVTTFGDALQTDLPQATTAPKPRYRVAQIEQPSGGFTYVARERIQESPLSTSPKFHRTAAEERDALIGKKRILTEVNDLKKQLTDSTEAFIKTTNKRKERTITSKDGFGDKTTVVSLDSGTISALADAVNKAGAKSTALSYEQQLALLDKKKQTAESISTINVLEAQAKANIVKENRGASKTKGRGVENEVDNHYKLLAFEQEKNRLLLEKEESLKERQVEIETQKEEKRLNKEKIKLDKENATAAARAEEKTLNEKRQREKVEAAVEKERLKKEKDDNAEKVKIEKKLAKAEALAERQKKIDAQAKLQGEVSGAGAITKGEVEYAYAKGDEKAKSDFKNNTRWWNEDKDITAQTRRTTKADYNKKKMELESDLKGAEELGDVVKQSEIKKKLELEKFAHKSSQQNVDRLSIRDNAVKSNWEFGKGIKDMVVGIGKLVTLSDSRSNFRTVRKGWGKFARSYGAQTIKTGAKVAWWTAKKAAGLAWTGTKKVVGLATGAVGSLISGIGTALGIAGLFSAGGVLSAMFQGGRDLGNARRLTDSLSRGTSLQVTGGKGVDGLGTQFGMLSKDFLPYVRQSMLSTGKAIGGVQTAVTQLATERGLGLDDGGLAGLNQLMRYGGKSGALTATMLTERLKGEKLFGVDKGDKARVGESVEILKQLLEAQLKANVKLDIGNAISSMTTFAKLGPTWSGAMGAEKLTRIEENLKNPKTDYSAALLQKRAYEYLPSGSNFNDASLLIEEGFNTTRGKDFYIKYLQDILKQKGPFAEYEIKQLTGLNQRETRDFIPLLNDPKKASEFINARADKEKQNKEAEVNANKALVKIAEEGISLTPAATQNLTRIFDNLGQKGEEIIKETSVLLEALGKGEWMKALDESVRLFKEGWEAAKPLLAEAWGFARDYFAGPFKQDVRDAFNTALTHIEWGDIGAKIGKGVVGALWEGIVLIFDSVMKIITRALSSIPGIVTDIFGFVPKLVGKMVGADEEKTGLFAATSTMWEKGGELYDIASYTWGDAVREDPIVRYGREKREEALEKEERNKPKLDFFNETAIHGALEEKNPYGGYDFYFRDLAGKDVLGDWRDLYTPLQNHLRGAALMMPTQEERQGAINKIAFRKEQILGKLRDIYDIDKNLYVGDSDYGMAQIEGGILAENRLDYKRKYESDYARVEKGLGNINELSKLEALLKRIAEAVEKDRPGALRILKNDVFPK